MYTLHEQLAFYRRLHEQWKPINETYQVDQLLKLAIACFCDDLKLEKAMILIHDEATGLFKVKAHRGFDHQQSPLYFQSIRVLLSGELIECLRNSNLLNTELFFLVLPFCLCHLSHKPVVLLLVQ